jgi:hypothetical protein
MLKRYTFWLTAAIIFLFINTIFHTASLFISLPASNDTERQLLELLSTYKFDLGAGFHPTFGNMFLALSSCFSFVCLLGGLTLGYLLLKGIGADIMKGIIGINVLVFGGIFVVMVVFTFIVPIVLSGLIFINLLMAFIMIRGAREMA